MLRRLLARRTRDEPLGRRGERIAARDLRRRHYRVLARNVRAPIGEIDILCESPDGRCIVVVEVKTRRANAADQPPPEASVTAAKRAKLVALTRWARRANGWHDRPIRIDVVAVTLPDAGRPEIRHFENAVDARGRAP